MSNLEKLARRQRQDSRRGQPVVDPARTYMRRQAERIAANYREPAQPSSDRAQRFIAATAPLP